MKSADGVSKTSEEVTTIYNMCNNIFPAESPLYPTINPTFNFSELSIDSKVWIFSPREGKHQIWKPWIWKPWSFGGGIEPNVIAETHRDG